MHSNPRYRRAQLDETNRKNALLLLSANYFLFFAFSAVVHLAPTGAHSSGGQKTIKLLDWRKGGLFDVWFEICSSISFFRSLARHTCKEIIITGRS